MNAIDPVISHILRGLIALVFAEAVYHKLSDMRAFRDTLANYQLVPERSLRLVAAAIIALEIAAAVSLLWPGAPSAAPAVAASILVVYAAAIAINLLRGRGSIDCGCSGAVVRQSLSAGLVIRNAVLVACCWAAMLVTTVRPLGAMDTGTVLFGVAGLFLVYVASNRLLAESAHLREALNHDD
ncbi:MAG: MauE/DoxX family redox-associated membrane protein [Steroidobacteraceae bacterium]|nr:hypothetical protein [Steroidobacteraceae bacterium]MBP7014110.1 hypothetical protein [Steroidobacteraceae bacterium]